MVGLKCLLLLFLFYSLGFSSSNVHGRVSLSRNRVYQRLRTLDLFRNAMAHVVETAKMYDFSMNINIFVEDL